VKRFLSISAMTLLAAAAGCSQSKAPTPAVTQLEPMPAVAPAPTPIAETQAPTPVSEPIASTDTVTPPAPDNSLASPGTTQYTVKAGDTLYHIALVHYGAGKDWKKIVAANPGLSPKTLKIGQTITLP
jgi:nucleoid-associated protein YgaU